MEAGGFGSTVVTRVSRVEPPQVDIFVYLISGCPAQASRPT
jgi:hypothetical protein